MAVVSAIYIGGSEVQKVYRGSTLIFDNSAPLVSFTLTLNGTVLALGNGALSLLGNKLEFS